MQDVLNARPRSHDGLDPTGVTATMLLDHGGGVRPYGDVPYGEWAGGFSDASRSGTEMSAGSGQWSVTTPASTRL